MILDSCFVILINSLALTYAKLYHTDLLRECGPGARGNTVKLELYDVLDMRIDANGPAYCMKYVKTHFKNYIHLKVLSYETVRSTNHQGCYPNLKIFNERYCGDRLLPLGNYTRTIKKPTSIFLSLTSRGNGFMKARLQFTAFQKYKPEPSAPVHIKTTDVYEVKIENDGLSFSTIIGIICGAIVLVIICVICCISGRRREASNRHSMPSTHIYLPVSQTRSQSNTVQNVLMPMENRVPQAYPSHLATQPAYNGVDVSTTDTTSSLPHNQTNLHGPPDYSQYLASNSPTSQSFGPPPSYEAAMRTVSSDVPAPVVYPSAPSL